MRLRVVSGVRTVESLRMPPLSAEALLLYRTDGTDRSDRCYGTSRPGRRPDRPDRGNRSNRPNRCDRPNCPVNICTTRKMP